MCVRMSIVEPRRICVGVRSSTGPARHSPAGGTAPRADQAPALHRPRAATAPPHSTNAPPPALALLRHHRRLQHFIIFRRGRRRRRRPHALLGRQPFVRVYRPRHGAGGGVAWDGCRAGHAVARDGTRSRLTWRPASAGRRVPRRTAGAGPGRRRGSGVGAWDITRLGRSEQRGVGPRLPELGGPALRRGRAGPFPCCARHRRDPNGALSAHARVALGSLGRRLDVERSGLGERRRGAGEPGRHSLCAFECVPSLRAFGVKDLSPRSPTHTHRRPHGRPAARRGFQARVPVL